MHINIEDTEDKISSVKNHDIEPKIFKACIFNQEADTLS